MRLEKAGLRKFIASHIAKFAGPPKNASQKTAANEVRKQDTVQISRPAKEIYRQMQAENRKNVNPNEGTAPAEDQLRRVLSGSGFSRAESKKIANHVMNTIETEKPDRAEKLKAIRKRLEGGFYDSPEVIEKIARGLMRDMNFSKLV